jgi:beta-glucanase (GH16 family)
MDAPRSVAVLSVLVGCAGSPSADTDAGGSQRSSANGAGGWMDGSTDASSEIPGSASGSEDAGVQPEVGSEAGVNDAGRESDAAAADAGRADGPRPDSGGDGGGAGPEQCANRVPVASTWTLVWSDEFEKDGAPDPSNWGFESGFVRNQELQWYQPSNATVAGGLLTIAAQRQQVTNPSYAAGSADWTKSRQYAQYTSSSMTTSGKRSFQYGRFEMCGQIDTRLGSWPAFWILGSGRGWPSSGEVDIMEYYANGVRANVCIPSAGNCDWSGSVSQPLASLGATWSSQFHLWAMEWNATDVNLYLDDKLVYDFKISRIAAGANPYTGNPFYMIVNLAIGANGGDPSSVAFPMTYKVDYVRVYR